MENQNSPSLFSWIKNRSFELRQLMDIELQQKKVLVPKVNQLNETLFLYRFENFLLKNLEQLCLLEIYINSESKIENYDFFTYVSSILNNVRDALSMQQLDIYPQQYNEYVQYLYSVMQELDNNLRQIELVMQQKYDFYLQNIKNISNSKNIEYSWTLLAEKFSIKCSGHLERISLLKAFQQDWKICKVCHAFICPTCGANLNVCPNLAGKKHDLDLIGLPLENIINFLQSDSQKGRSDDSFIIMDKIDK